MYDQAKEYAELKEQAWEVVSKLGDTAVTKYDKTTDDIEASIQKQELAIVKMDKEKRKIAESTLLKEKKIIESIQAKVKMKRNNF
jgi:hypothetical protein